MTKSTVAVVGARWPDLSVEMEILEPLGVEVRSDPGANSRALVDAVTGADVVLAAPAPELDHTALAAFGGIGVVRYGVGVDNVDLVAASQLGTWVVVVPDYGTESVALHTVTLTLACLRKLSWADRVVRNDRWALASLRPLHLPQSLAAGIVGYGRIGRRVAELFSAVGFRRILATGSGGLDADEHMEPVSLPELLELADVVTLHLPAAADGSALLTRQRIEMMRPGSVLINTARGSLVDTGGACRRSRRLATCPHRNGCRRPATAGSLRFAGVEDRVIFTPQWLGTPRSPSMC